MLRQEVRLALMDRGYDDSDSVMQVAELRGPNGVSLSLAVPFPGAYQQQCRLCGAGGDGMG